MNVRTEVALVCLIVCPGAVSADVLKVGTWNIRLAEMDRWDRRADAPGWRERMPSVSAVLRARDCDLVGLQECSTPQAEFLRNELKGWTLVGVATNDTVRRKTSQANGVLYRPGRLDLLDWGTFSLSDRPDVPGSMAWNTRCVRSCTWALFKDRGSGRRIMHFNTHFDHKSEEARREGMKLVLGKMDELTPTGALRILTGDLNSPPDSEPIARARAKLRRAYEITETPPKGPWRTDNLWKTLPSDENLTSRETGKRIDHIFVSDGVRVRSHETFVDFASPGFYASDHFMLAVELVLPAESCNSTK